MAGTNCMSCDGWTGAGPLCMDCYKNSEAGSDARLYHDHINERRVKYRNPPVTREPAPERQTLFEKYMLLLRNNMTDQNCEPNPQAHPLARLVSEELEDIRRRLNLA